MGGVVVRSLVPARLVVVVFHEFLQFHIVDHAVDGIGIFYS